MLVVSANQCHEKKQGKAEASEKEQNWIGAIYFGLGSHQCQGKREEGKTSEKSEEEERDQDFCPNFVKIKNYNRFSIMFDTWCKSLQLTFSIVL